LLGFLLVLLLAYWVGGYVSVWLCPDRAWAYKWRYSWDSELSDATIVIISVPHDCEFLTAPIGSKHCHYEKAMTTIRIKSGVSGRFASHDEGKTWRQADPILNEAVYVSWGKIED
jgi:hypothetical protein